MNVLSTYALSTARHASRNSRLLAVMASDAGAAKPPTHAATAAAAAAAAPRRARANTDTEKSASRVSDKPTGLSNASVSPSVPKLFLAGRDARAATRGGGKVPARASPRGARQARRRRDASRRDAGCESGVGELVPRPRGAGGTLRVLLSAYVAATVSPRQLARAHKTTSIYSRWCAGALEASRGRSPRAARAGRLGPAALRASGPRGWFMRRASSLVGLPDDPVGDGGRGRAAEPPPSRKLLVARQARDPKDRRRRRTSTARRRLVALGAALAALVLRAVAYLASWYPGDETIRASSESFLRLMFSRSGVSFGTTKSFAFAREVTIDAGDAIKTTREAAVVQGEIARVPRWRAGEDVNVTRHAELEWRDRRADGCFFRVHADAPAITFFDDGATRVKRLRGLDELQRVAVRAAKGGDHDHDHDHDHESIDRAGTRDDHRDDFSRRRLAVRISAPRRRRRGRGSAKPGARRRARRRTRPRPDPTRFPVIHSC